MTGLRVISGKARGRHLRPVPGDTTRPITDRTKESLFDILGPDIHNASLLDLFAGTGSVGIEALSRGAEFVRFIDLNQRAVETVRFNLGQTGFTQQAEVLRTDAYAYLSRPADRPFDYIYIAPPQYKQMWKRALVCVDQHLDWLCQDAWVIAQIHPIEYPDLEPSQELSHLVEFDQRRYGSTLLLFYQQSIPAE